MQNQIFEGNYLEIGKKLGTIYKENKFDINKVTIDQNLYENQLQIYQKYYSGFLQELVGAALSGGYDKDKFLYSFIGSYLKWTLKENLKNDPTERCSIFGVKVGKDLFVGRNYDWVPVTEKIFKIYKYHFLDKIQNSFMAISDMNIDSEEEGDPKFHRYLPIDAINDKGLYIGLTYAFNKNWSYGLGSTHMVKFIAETCSTVKEAIQVFEKVPVCIAKNFFIADKNGDMAVIEHIAGTNFKVIYPKDNILIKTNHFIDPELITKDTVLTDNPQHTTFLRYYEILRGINNHKKDFKESDIIKILGDENFYTRQNFPHFKTIWTLALDMTKQKYNIYDNLFGERRERNINL